MISGHTTVIPNPHWAEDVQKSDDLQTNVDDASELVATSARGKAPVLTGALQDSIQVVHGQDGQDQIIADVPYSAFVEFGTQFTTAQPFLRPAADEVIGRGGP